MKYPLSHNAGKPLTKFFYDIIMLHIPPGDDVVILDPTCGKRYMWERFFVKTWGGKRPIDNYERVLFSDIEDYGHNAVADFRDLEFHEALDGIVFDPPYLFGYKGSKDKRKHDYGGYAQTYGQLMRMMDDARTLFPKWLKHGGKVILKCADQYYPKERKFYPLHITWANLFTENGDFELIDVFVFIHHHLSPTAFQVKNRPCSVIMNQYFLVFGVTK